MKLGESAVVDNVKHQCLGMGSSVFYKETVSFWGLENGLLQEFWRVSSNSSNI